jgi:hypothetical protein
MTKTRIVMTIVLCGLTAFVVLRQSAKRDDMTMVRYDGCYEQYASHKINADDFNQFMSVCLR